MGAPDRLSVWPLEGGQYGIDAPYHGKTGQARADWQARRLYESGLRATVREEPEAALHRLIAAPGGATP